MPEKHTINRLQLARSSYYGNKTRGPLYLRRSLTTGGREHLEEESSPRKKNNRYFRPALACRPLFIEARYETTTPKETDRRIFNNHYEEEKKGVSLYSRGEELCERKDLLCHGHSGEKA